MTSRTSTGYQAVLNYVVRPPASLMADFEPALRSVFTRLWPGIDIKGCWFHYTQVAAAKAERVGVRQQMVGLFHHVEHYWFNTVGRAVLLVGGSDSRTNNAVESFYSQLRGALDGRSPRRGESPQLLQVLKNFEKSGRHRSAHTGAEASREAAS
ncbi:hypothetical protein M8J75_004576 [Diaphorina citri]|nr:hypothetical protein M8J75_004576 [Diaphorina citri]